MIRSRSGAAFSNSPLTLNTDSVMLTVAETVASITPRPPGGARLWRLLIMVLVGGIFVYLILMVSTPKADYVKSHAAVKEQITVVMNTFKRHEMMQDAIDFYSRCDAVKYIHIVWSEKSPPPQNMLAKYASRHHPEIFFSQQPTDSLNNRFKPLTYAHTDAIFAVDDDIRVPCKDLGLAYEVWSGSQRSLIGFMPRLHMRGKDGGLVYRCWWRVWLHGVYSIILTKAAFLHHDYFTLYTNTMPVGIRELVDRSRNCEDIAMQFLISNVTTLPPIFVKGHLDDLGVLNGISTSRNIASAGHMDKRSQCLNELVNIYHSNPLRKSHIIVDSAGNGWTNWPSTWMEFISSDLWKF